MLQGNVAEAFRAAEPFEPAYLRSFESGELARKAEEAVASLKMCRVCPWDCEIDRLADQTKVCKTGRYARVGSYFPHFGEEDCLRGWNGSGTIFFSWCNLRCVFCQNFDLSQQGKGREVTPEELARMMLALQANGCHNINFVTPEHVVPQILEALPLAIHAGLRLPIVYNTSAYDSLESIRLMEGVVDIYMPDFKFWDPELAKRYVKARDYPQAARAAIKEMHRQVGPLVFDAHGLAGRGVLVRHLVMPGGMGGTREVMRFLATELSPDTYVNIMAQYRPTGKVNRENYPEIDRMVTPMEHQEAVRIAYDEGLHRLDERGHLNAIRLRGGA
ncbi:MAG TPA: radical SAM protein [Candidatus Methylomirabilis sp.]|nr:radical SAM protein [Candidatus Methylomirabilis sp.]